jgi:hypothetical protein
VTYFNLRKRAEEPEPEEVEEEPEETAEDEPAEGPPARQYGPLLVGLLGPGRWLAARHGPGVALGVHVVAVWAIDFYGGWIAAGVILVWLLLVGLFTPPEALDRVSRWAERRSGGPSEEGSDPGDEEAGSEPSQPDPQEVLDLVRDLIGRDRGILLTALRGPLRAADTKAVRELLAAADIRVREGVRTGGGNGPGIHRDDLPPLPPPPGPPPGDGVVADQAANTNADNGLRVRSQEGMTIINDPADRRRSHRLKRP